MRSIKSINWGNKNTRSCRIPLLTSLWILYRLTKSNLGKLEEEQRTETSHSEDPSHTHTHTPIRFEHEYCKEKYVYLIWGERHKINHKCFKRSSGTNALEP